MADRNFNSKEALEREVKDLYVKVSIGASGAPTLVSGAAYGSASIARNSAGDYTLVLSNPYNQLRNFKAKLLAAAAEDIRVQLKSESVASDKSVSFMTLTDSTKTDPSDGSTLIIKLELKNVANN